MASTPSHHSVIAAGSDERVHFRQRRAIECIADTFFSWQICVGDVWYRAFQAAGGWASFTGCVTNVGGQDSFRHRNMAGGSMNSCRPLPVQIIDPATSRQSWSAPACNSQRCREADSSPRPVARPGHIADFYREHAHASSSTGRAWTDFPLSESGCANWIGLLVSRHGFPS